MDLFDYNAEQAVLGAVLINNDNIETLLDKINIECFLEDKNKAIYNSMVQLYIEDKVIDVVTLTSKVSALGHDIKSDYINDVSEAIINLKNFDSYVNIIYDLHLKRELDTQCRSILDTIGSGNVLDLVYNFQEHMLKKMDIDRHNEITNVKDIIHDYVGELGSLEGNAIQTGFKDLNKLIGGFNKGDVVIIAGRPAMGKSAVALDMVLDLAKRGYHSLLFSLEQPKREMVLRMLSSESLIDYARLKRNTLFNYEQERLNKAVKWFSSKDIYIDDTSAISIAKLKAKVRKKILKHSIDVIIIDYIQLMSVDKRKGRFEGIGDIARELKHIAKEFNVVVVALSQLNREIEKRGKDAKPLLSDLKESGDIEQVADYIFFIDRDFYDPDSDRCDLILAKHRHGSPGTVKLIFKKNCFRFFNTWKGNR